VSSHCSFLYIPSALDDQTLRVLCIHLHVLPTAAEVVRKAPELGLVASQLAGGLPATAATKLRVTAMDSGTYPMDGGGVATCQQVVLDGLPDVQ
jgi:hypothetical protein